MNALLLQARVSRVVECDFSTTQEGVTVPTHPADFLPYSVDELYWFQPSRRRQQRHGYAICANLEVVLVTDDLASNIAFDLVKGC